MEHAMDKVLPMILLFTGNIREPQRRRFQATLIDLAKYVGQMNQNLSFKGTLPGL